jgi:hypothetical protein
MSDPAALTCPHGHTSSDRGYCTVCGTTMAAPLPPPDSAPTTLVPPSSSPFGSGHYPITSQPCPHCSAPLDEGSRFCEVCGYDPETGSLPEAPEVRPAPAEPLLAPAPASTLPAPGAPPTSPAGHAGPTGPASPGDPLADATSGPTGGGYAGGPRPSPGAGPTAGPWASAPVPPGGVPGGAPVPGGTAIIAVITADRPYYDSHYVSEVAFPLGAPARTIELPAAPVHIGRRSRSRGTDPAIDLAGPPEDSGVSHTHASLLPRPDGTWELVDHGSTNGTYVNESPEPLPANQPRRVGPGDRIYVGAWTRITLEAAPYR